MKGVKKCLRPSDYRHGHAALAPSLYIALPYAQGAILWLAAVPSWLAVLPSSCLFAPAITSLRKVPVLRNRLEL